VRDGHGTQNYSVSGRSSDKSMLLEMDCFS
jgi:hypothetical protein